MPYHFDYIIIFEVVRKTDKHFRLFYHIFWKKIDELFAELRISADVYLIQTHLNHSPDWPPTIFHLI